MDLAQPDAIIFSVGAGDKAVHRDYADCSDAKPSPAGLREGLRCMGLGDNDARWQGYMVGDRLTDMRAGAGAVWSLSVLIEARALPAVQ